MATVHKAGDAGHRSLYLSHAERALYHLSYTPMVCTSQHRSHVHGEVAEWSKALRSGRSLFGGVGSNPTLTNFSSGCGNRGLTVRILALQASGPGSTPGGCTLYSNAPLG